MFSLAKDQGSPAAPHCPDPSALPFSTNPKTGWKLLLGGFRVCFTLDHPHADLSDPEGESPSPVRCKRAE